MKRISESLEEKSEIHLGFAHPAGPFEVLRQSLGKPKEVPRGFKIQEQSWNKASERVQKASGPLETTKQPREAEKKPRSVPKPIKKAQHRSRRPPKSIKGARERPKKAPRRLLKDARILQERPKGAPKRPQSVPKDFQMAPN